MKEVRINEKLLKRNLKNKKENNFKFSNYFFNFWNV